MMLLLYVFITHLVGTGLALSYRWYSGDWKYTADDSVMTTVLYAVIYTLPYLLLTTSFTFDCIILLRFTLEHFKTVNSIGNGLSEYQMGGRKVNLMRWNIRSMWLYYAVDNFIHIGLIMFILTYVKGV